MTRSEMLEVMDGPITLKPSGAFDQYFTFKMRKRERDGQLILTVLRDFVVSTRAGKICIPVGFESDGASIPKLARGIAGDPFDFDYIRDAVLHDFLYRDLAQFAAVPKAMADVIFKDTMWNSKVPKYKIIPFYLAVRWGGGGSYKKLKTMTLP